MTQQSESNVLEIPGGEVVAISKTARAIMVPMVGGFGYVLITRANDNQPPGPSDTKADVAIYSRNSWAGSFYQMSIPDVLANLPRWTGKADDVHVERTLLSTLLRALRLAYEGYTARLFDDKLPQPPGAYAYEALDHDS